MDAFGTPDRLAGVAGLAPVPKDSGRIGYNLRRPRRYNRRLLRVFSSPTRSPAGAAPLPGPSASAREPGGRTVGLAALRSPRRAGPAEMAARLSGM
ncbi:transposase [Streptomyces sp. AV19]|nr:transposase [Streptomyces sp. AV19]